MPMRLNHQALRVIRELNGLSQSKAAELAGIDRPNYAHMEAGRRKGTPEQIRKIALMLDVPMTALLGPERDEVAA